MDKSELRNKHPQLALLVKDFSAIISGNTKYIDEQLTWRYDPSVLRLNNPGKPEINGITMKIHEEGGGCGFFAEYRSVLANLLYADWMGLEPVVTWGENFLYYDEEMPEKNAFLYYFEAVGDEKNIERTNNIVESKSRIPQWVYMQFHNNEHTYEVCDKYLEALATVNKKYIIIKPALEERMHNEFSELIKKEKKILGVHYRGTDYKCGYNNHPKIVTVEEYIAVIMEAIEKEGFSAVFLATDQEGVYERIANSISVPVYYYNDTLRGSGDVSVAFSKVGRNHHRYLLGYEVLRDMISLSWCDGLVGGLSQVTVCAKVFAIASEHKYCFIRTLDNGLNINGARYRVRRQIKYR